MTGCVECANYGTAGPLLGNHSSMLQSGHCRSFSLGRGSDRHCTPPSLTHIYDASAFVVVYPPGYRETDTTRNNQDSEISHMLGFNKGTNNSLDMYVK